MKRVALLLAVVFGLVGITLNQEGGSVALTLRASIRGYFTNYFIKGTSAEKSDPKNQRSR